MLTIVSCVLRPEYVKNTGSRNTSVNGSSSCLMRSREHAARHGGADQEAAEHRVQADDVGETRRQREQHQRGREHGRAQRLPAACSRSASRPSGANRRGPSKISTADEHDAAGDRDARRRRPAPRLASTTATTHQAIGIADGGGGQRQRARSAIR